MHLIITLTKLDEEDQLSFCEAVNHIAGLVGLLDEDLSAISGPESLGWELDYDGVVAHAKLVYDEAVSNTPTEATA
jgi:hypothetical protein